MMLRTPYLTAEIIASKIREEISQEKNLFCLYCFVVVENIARIRITTAFIA